MAALGASVSMPAAAERTSAMEMLVHSINALMAKVMAPVGDPITTPTPHLKPEITVKAAPPKPGVVAQCGYASIHAKPAPDGESMRYRVSFAETMIDEMIGEGCGQFYQGCNICSVIYVGCEPAERAACKDAACLEKTCERTVRCSAKTCTANGPLDGKAPSCKSRLVRTACLKPIR